MRNERIDKLQDFSVRLRSLRKEKRRKQTDIAELLGYSPNHYQKIEYGQINITVITLMTLADYFGVSTDYLLGRSDDR